jgi:hypothetical protein
MSSAVGSGTTPERVIGDVSEGPLEMSKWRVPNIMSRICRIFGDEQVGASLIAA